MVCYKKYWYIAVLACILMSCGKSVDPDDIHYPFSEVDSIIDSYKRDTIFPIKKLTPMEKMELRSEKRKLKGQIKHINKQVKCMSKCGCVKGSGYDPGDLKALRKQIKTLSITVDSIRTVLNKQSEL